MILCKIRKSLYSPIRLGSLAFALYSVNTLYRMQPNRNVFTNAGPPLYVYKHISLRFRKARRKFLHQICPAFLFLKVIINLKHTWGGATAKFNTRETYLEGATAKFNTRETYLEGATAKFNTLETYLEGATTKFNTRETYLEGATAKFNTRETYLEGATTKFNT